MAGGMAPADIGNQALDGIGYAETVSDLEEGTPQAQVILRAYGECLKQLLRAANWNFARKQAPLTLLADASGQTPDVGTVVPFNWMYEYAYPTDCAKVRFIPFNWQNPGVGVPAGNIQIPQTPLADGLNPQAGPKIVPAKFQVATDFNYPPPVGSETWNVQGQSPQGRTVILTNVKQAQAIYTAIMLYPSIWDALFRSAFVAYLASEISLPIWSKKGETKQGIAMRDSNIGIVKGKLTEARLVDGNEGVSSSSLSVDWMRARNVGSAWGPGGGGWGGAGWGGQPFGDGAWGWDTLQLANGANF